MSVVPKSYYKRYQVKPRRRREFKTDYKQRVALIKTPKNKYSVRKYRFVVRFTNSKVVCQFIYATLDGDKVLAAACSDDLAKYGIKFGLKNQSAAYAVGLLAGRRALTALGINNVFKGALEGEQMIQDGINKFTAVLDVGIKRVTLGCKIMTALKGALDAGVDIPYSEHKFPGYDAERKLVAPDMHHDRIYGKHIAQYMAAMQESNPNKYSQHFSDFTKAGTDASNIESLYTKAFTAILTDSNPALEKRPTRNITHTVASGVVKTSDGSSYKTLVKLTRDQRRENVARKLAIIASAQ